MHSTTVKSLIFVASKPIKMIQRIQTIYLFLAIVALILMNFFPLATFLSDFLYLKFYFTGVKNMAPGGEVPLTFTMVSPLIIAVVAIAFLTVMAIAAYRNRVRQIQVTNIAMMLNILFVLAVFFVYVPLIKRRVSIEPDFASGIGMYLPIVSLLFLILANRAIKRDENLVRSADRLR